MQATQSEMRQIQEALRCQLQDTTDLETVRLTLHAQLATSSEELATLVQPSILSEVLQSELEVGSKHASVTACHDLLAGGSAIRPFGSGCRVAQRADGRVGGDPFLQRKGLLTFLLKELPCNFGDVLRSWPMPHRTPFKTLIEEFSLMPWSCKRAPWRWSCVLYTRA